VTSTSDNATWTATSVQFGQDQLDPWNTFFWVDIHRHTTAIVGHFEGVICMQNNFNFSGVAR
jgi:hypothetical protein